MSNLQLRKKQTKFIFITGGVTSSLGKGLTASSLACLISQYDLKVSMQKMDPYINIDAGTMSPDQHGEVFVTRDGAETDLDLGNYERFANIQTSKIHSITAGQIYKSVIEKERNGHYLGETVQVIPHITNEIQNKILDVVNKDKPDILIIEIGGTVGDIESIPFLEAIRQFFQIKQKKNHCLFIHMTLIPKISLANELKTKPSQHSIKELLSIGIQADILLCRTSEKLTDEMRNKLSIFCNLSKECVIEALDIKNIIYELPLLLNETSLLNIVLKKLDITTEKPPLKLKKWENIIKINKQPKTKIKIAIVGKYIESTEDTYKSLYEAILHGSIENLSWAEITLISAESLKKETIKNKLKDFSGIIIAGGFGERGFEGKILACQYSRENKIPTLGICLGMQAMIVELARNVAHLKNASSTEFDPFTKYPIISILETQQNIKQLGASMRLGSNKITLNKDSRIYKIYNSQTIYERHRHRYEVNPIFYDILTQNGLKITSFFEDGTSNILESIELDSFWYIGVQFHPEFESKPTQAHPLFKDFIANCINNYSKS